MNQEGTHKEYLKVAGAKAAEVARRGEAIQIDNPAVATSEPPQSIDHAAIVIQSSIAEAGIREANRSADNDLKNRDDGPGHAASVTQRHPKRRHPGPGAGLGCRAKARARPCTERGGAAEPARTAVDQVVLLTVMVGNFELKSFALAATVTATLRATAR